MSRDPSFKFDAEKGKILSLGDGVKWLSRSQANHKLDRDSVEPDPSLIELNNELGKCDEVTSAALAPMEHQFVYFIFEQ